MEHQQIPAKPQLEHPPRSPAAKHLIRTGQSQVLRKKLPDGCAMFGREITFEENLMRRDLDEEVVPGAKGEPTEKADCEEDGENDDEFDERQGDNVKRIAVNRLMQSRTLYDRCNHRHKCTDHRRLTAAG